VSLIPSKPVVLVVEDEILIRIGMLESLEDIGCDAIEAADSAEALSLLDIRADIWLLFSDINMPGALDGLALAHQVHRNHPAIRLMLTSGRGAPEIAEMPCGTHFVPKPYAVQDLARRMLSMRGQERQAN
jgi:CheY-like chemotaxis protein